MRAGLLRERVTIEEPTESQSSTGASTVTWSAFASDLPAAVEPLSGREFFSAAQVQSAVTTRIRIRHLAGVSERMRAKHVDRDGATNYYDIQAVLRIGGREMHLMCVRRGAEGFRNG